MDWTAYGKLLRLTDQETKRGNTSFKIGRSRIYFIFFFREKRLTGLQLL